ncbi:MAG: SRPBCC domain-containing protein [Crocosphaera sp.]
MSESMMDSTTNLNIAHDDITLSKSFANLQQSNKIFPSLHCLKAKTLVRDRWEKLVTTIEIPATVEEIWSALTDPDKLKFWLAVCHGSIENKDSDCLLDFEDGEFFFCRPITVDSRSKLQYMWRWLGIGQATSVTWELEPINSYTRITVTEEALNPPWDWQTWNGGGWPGILEQLAAYLRTGISWRWPWRRVGPYIQIELSSSVYEVWDRLFNSANLKYWLLSTQGSIIPGQSLSILMGDASGSITMNVHEVIEPGQLPPSFLPSLNFSLNRPIWKTDVGGRLWLEPAGWGRSLLQVVHYNWESLPPELQLSERKILTRYWVDTAERASQMFRPRENPVGPHNW